MNKNRLEDEQFGKHYELLHDRFKRDCRNGIALITIAVIAIVALLYTLFW